MPYESKLARLREWLAIYHQEKSEAAEAEKRKAKAAKKEGPRKICGICRHVPVNIIDLGDVQRTVPCEKKGINVPAYLVGCHEFEPRAATDQPRYFFAKNGMDAAAYAESVAQRKKDTEELCGLVELYAAAHAESKRAHFETKKDRAGLTAKCERLTEQRNRLSNSLVGVTRRVKEVEQENDILARKLVDCTAKWNDLSEVCVEKNGLIDRLRNAKSRLTGEMYRAEAELEDEWNRRKEVEKENVALRSKLEQAAEDRKRELDRTIELEMQLSKALGDQWFRGRRWVYAVEV